MNCDIASITGKSHRICEDYARCNSEWRHFSGANKPEMLNLLKEKPYVILADGCSSAVDADFGARILVKCAENFLNHRDYYPSVIAASYATAKGMGLDETSLDATLLTAQYHQESRDVVKYQTYGDGVVAAQKNDGTLEIVDIAFPSGYPYYLSYSLSEARMESMLKLTNNNKQVRTHHFFYPDGSTSKDQTEVDGPESQGQAYTDEYNWLALFSDGVHSFYSHDATNAMVPIQMIDVVKKLTDFKGSFRGEFVQRTMNGFLKHSAKQGWMHHDDVTMAVIHMGE